MVKIGWKYNVIADCVDRFRRVLKGLVASGSEAQKYLSTKKALVNEVIVITPVERISATLVRLNPTRGTHGRG